MLKNSNEKLQLVVVKLFNSSTRVKLIQKLSAAIDVTIGTEQGHTMSPELFKLYIHELSIRLEQIEELDVPLLNGVKVSHLLWADDLILLALDADSLQKLLNCLHDYAEKWELVSPKQQQKMLSKLLT